MSIVVSGLSFAYPNKEKLFDNLSFTIARGEKASLIGNNGCGKSTLVKILSGPIGHAGGDISVGGVFNTVPQHFGQYDGMTIAGALGVEAKIGALRAILGGSTDARDYDLLQDDWDIMERVAAQLAFWGLGHLSADTPLASMSGGEKTRAFLAGIGMTSPQVILMDEPTNHLDRSAREKLYAFIAKSDATVLLVSHDRELLNLVDTTFELTPNGIARYGGGYDFYREQHDLHLAALTDKIAEKQKAIRHANITARQAIERKNKSDAQGGKKKQKEGMPKIMMGGLKDRAEKSTSNLREVLTDKTTGVKEELHNLKESLADASKIKLNVKDSGLHKGKILVEGTSLDFTYNGEKDLWSPPLDLLILSGERIRIEGNNGSGKTTLLKIIMGELEPTAGEIKRARFSHVYIDQEYSFIDDSRTVFSQLERHNIRNLPEHELKTELHRFLFPSGTWDNSCANLSGGEKMRLTLCCLLISNDTPEVFILDEPTNNLDVASMEILTSVLRGYRGTVIVISHDDKFVREIGVERTVCL